MWEQLKAQAARDNRDLASLQARAWGCYVTRLVIGGAFTLATFVVQTF